MVEQWLNGKSWSFAYLVDDIRISPETGWSLYFESFLLKAWHNVHHTPETKVCIAEQIPLYIDLKYKKIL